MTEDTCLREKALRPYGQAITVALISEFYARTSQNEAEGDVLSDIIYRAMWAASSDDRRRIEALEAALKRLLDRDERNTCQHEDTRRGGFLWTICDACGAKWADDEGGKPEWQDPPEWVQARAALSSKEGQS